MVLGNSTELLPCQGAFLMISTWVHTLLLQNIICISQLLNLSHHIIIFRLRAHELIEAWRVLFTFVIPVPRAVSGTQLMPTNWMIRPGLKLLDYSFWLSYLCFLISISSSVKWASICFLGNLRSFRIASFQLILCPNQFAFLFTG